MDEGEVPRRIDGVATPKAALVPQSGLRRGPRGRTRPIRLGLRGRPKKVYYSFDDEYEVSDGGESEFVNLVDFKNEFAGLVESEDPKIWEDVVKTEEGEAWEAAIADEFLEQIRNKTWEIVDKPNKGKIFGSRFIFRTKINNSSKSRKKVVKLVAQDNSNRTAEDFRETFSPFVQVTSVRLLAALSAELGLEVHQVDLKQSYLDDTLEEDMYMEVPQRLEDTLTKILAGCPVGSQKQIIQDEEMMQTTLAWRLALKEGHKVCVLRKPLHGLQQPGLQWHRTLVAKLHLLELSPLDQDRFMFSSTIGSDVMIVAVYAGGMLIATKNPIWMTSIKESLLSTFEMIDCGRVKLCLGIEFNQSFGNHAIQLTQRRYAEALLKRFPVEEYTPRISIEVYCDLHKPATPDKKLMSEYPYRALIGALMYLAVSTRPDISFAVNILSQFIDNFDVTHWKAATNLLHYIGETLDYGIKYKKSGQALYGYVYAHWSLHSVDCRSYNGNAFILAGGSVSWEAGKQRAVASTSTEAEYMATSEATKEALHLRGMLRQIGISCETTVLFSDKNEIQDLIKTRDLHSRTKHIDIRHHFIRQMVEQNKISLKYISTKEMPITLTEDMTICEARDLLVKLGIGPQITKSHW